MRFERLASVCPAAKPWALLAVTLLFSGCAAVPAGKSVVGELSSKPDASELEFWHTLETRRLTTNDDAFHGVLLYIDGDDPTTSYEARVGVLKQRGMLPTNFHGGEDEAIERGTLAVALVKALDLKGGLTMHLFGTSPRYALRELCYRRIYPESGEQQLFSGAEFLGIMGRVEDYKEGDPANFPAKVLYVGAPPTEYPPVTVLRVDSQPEFLSTTASELSLADPATSEPASQPAPMKLPDGPLNLVITGVRGKAEVRMPPATEWTKAETNEELKEGAELRTGLKSAVQLQIRPDQTITVDRLGVVKIDRATLAAGKFVTNVSMSYGRTRYDIDAANREYDATVRSPNSTLGIRGTRVSLLDQRPFPPEAVSLTGTAQFRNIHRQLIALGKKGQGKTKIIGDQNNAAQFALDQAVVDPVVADARTDSEEPLVASLLSRGAVFDFNRELGIPVVTGGTVPRTDAELIPLLPGNLDFVARWTANVNFNIGVFTPNTVANPGGEALYPAPGLTQSPSGGMIPFDHRGGPNGGIELAHWDNTAFPTGLYTVIAANQSNVSARVRMDGFMYGKRIINDPNGGAAFLNQGEIDEGAVKAIGGGFEGEVPPGLSLIIFYDVELPDDSTAIASASASKTSKKQPKPAANKPSKSTGLLNRTKATKR